MFMATAAGARSSRVAAATTAFFTRHESLVFSAYLFSAGARSAHESASAASIEAHSRRSTDAAQWPL